MTEDIKNRFISNKRLQSYNSFDEYKKNLRMSEKYYSLRNSIDFYFTQKISSDWLDSDVLHKDSQQKVQEAKNKILRRKESLTHDKVLAELSFGFWTSLFRKSYSNLFRVKDLQHIFPNLPSKNEQLINRNILDKKFNHIRKFRNRVFHYERILNKPEYKNIDKEIQELLVYFDIEVYRFAEEFLNE
ncbi:hypothetical protein JHD50_08735 [Sulfurimonas sp. MAG313]|nr:hypothetical protein [Sulfurimonas sp. MAG313]MDF1881382.1 hypothetical protein [Sulfurimonas sp. MAG313]